MPTTFPEPIAEYIWNIKYRYRYHDKLIDKTPEQTWHRVAKAIAKVENKSAQAHWQQQFTDILTDFKFLPGGRILAGAGTKHRVTLFNCFVMPISDSLPGIFDGIKEGALTLQQGGGVGYDFSVLRPEGSRVKKTDSAASGPISFMRIWNAMCATMLSTGARRGAMMGILRCDHPDIEAFIKAKANPRELRHFNVSVLITDEFMQAVQNNKPWQLVFPLEKKEKPNAQTILHRFSGSATPVPCRVSKEISARKLWELIIESAYNYAEPGVLFEDTINRMNTLWYREWINATNPCGEIPLPSYGACNLGAINLTQFVENAFTQNVKINWQKLKETTTIATRFLDNVIDVSTYPRSQQKQMAMATRRIGLGLTGLADLFVMMDIRYGSAESLQLASEIMKTIAETTWQTSIELAKEKGIFPAYDKEKYLGGDFVKTLNKDIQNDLAKYGVRNSHHNTIAPAGTISLLANNVSNGLEPIFNPRYERKVCLADNNIKKFNVTDYALRLWEGKYQVESLPKAWMDTHTLMPEDHLAMQHAVQPYIDNAISKTINIPANFPFEKIAAVYLQAYEYGLKGCTIFRPNAITGSVLEASFQDDDVNQCCQI